MDNSGVLYGAAVDELNQGFVFKVDPQNSQETTLYDFCLAQDGCPQGQAPLGRDPTGLAFGANGTLIGTTAEGGANGQGVVFQLGGADYSEYSVFHSFCARASCADGARPLEGVLADPAGDIFGTASSGGRSGGVTGNIFEIIP